MPIQPADREDMFAEAANLLPRAEWKSTASAHFADPSGIMKLSIDPGVSIILGRTRIDGLRVFAGPDFSAGFDPNGRLRRVYWLGEKLRCGSGAVFVRQVRRQEGRAIRFAAIELGVDESTRWLNCASAVCVGIVSMATRNLLTLARTLPEDGETAAKLMQSLDAVVTAGIRIADSM